MLDEMNSIPLGPIPPLASAVSPSHTTWLLLAFRPQFRSELSHSLGTKRLATLSLHICLPSEDSHQRLLSKRLHLKILHFHWVLRKEGRFFCKAGSLLNRSLSPPVCRGNSRWSLPLRWLFQAKRGFESFIGRVLSQMALRCMLTCWISPPLGIIDQLHVVGANDGRLNIRAFATVTQPAADINHSNSVVRAIVFMLVFLKSLFGTCFQ